jgi:hypothetical protein
MYQGGSLSPIWTQNMYAFIFANKIWKDLKNIVIQINFLHLSTFCVF